MYIENLTLEVTRKCNLKCSHCMRGNAQNKKMDNYVIFKLFQHIDEVRNLVIGGGEPSLAIDTINTIYNEIIQHDVKVENVFIVTNGKKVSLELLKCFMKLKYICTDNEISGFAISNDIYHINERGFYRNIEDYVEEMYKYNEENEMTPIWVEEQYIMEHTNKDSSNWFSRGRAKDWGTNDDEYLDNLILDNLDNPTSILGNMYVCYNGDVVGDENMSYVDMKNHVRGNIQDWFTLLLNLRESTRQNYNWCKNKCNNYNDCSKWEEFNNVILQIKKD